ncbi:hypothetical protein ACHAWF_003061 [Thalassiosira exigua]
MIPARADELPLDVRYPTTAVAVAEKMALRQRAKALAVAGGAGLGAVTFYRYWEVKQHQDNSPRDELWSFTNSEKKKVVIIGGGVVGVTAAFKAALKGHQVAIIESRTKPGKECSACAAGGMQRSNPIVDRGTWISVTKSFLPLTRFVLGGPDEPYKFFHIEWLSALTDPFFLRWSATFSKTSLFPCSEQRSLQNEMLAFTKWAVHDMVEMLQNDDHMAENVGFNSNGSISLSYDPQPDHKLAHPSGMNTHEPSIQLKGDAIALQEPSILHQKTQPTNAKYEFETCAASSERFTEQLAECCETNPKLDVTFIYNTHVVGFNTASSLDGQRRKVTQLQTNRGVINVPGDAQVVVAAGAWTPRIASLMDLFVPVYPLKGE